MLYSFASSLDEDSIGVVRLLNDEDSPGNLMYYGTDSLGIKGWFVLPEGTFDSSGMYGNEYTFIDSLVSESDFTVHLAGDEDARVILCITVLMVRAQKDGIISRKL